MADPIAIQVGTLDQLNAAIAFGSTPAAQLAAALNDTRDVQGGVTILDPTSRDKEFVSNVTKSQLEQNTGDFAFHA